MASHSIVFGLGSQVLILDSFAEIMLFFSISRGRTIHAQYGGNEPSETEEQVPIPEVAKITSGQNPNRTS